MAGNSNAWQRFWERLGPVSVLRELVAQDPADLLEILRDVVGQPELISPPSPVLESSDRRPFLDDPGVVALEPLSSILAACAVSMLGAGRYGETDGFTEESAWYSRTSDERIYPAYLASRGLLRADSELILAIDKFLEVQPQSTESIWGLDGAQAREMGRICDVLDRGVHSNSDVAAGIVFVILCLDFLCWTLSSESLASRADSLHQWCADGTAISAEALVVFAEWIGLAGAATEMSHLAHRDFLRDLNVTWHEAESLSGILSPEDELILLDTVEATFPGETELPPTMLQPVVVEELEAETGPYRSIRVHGSRPTLSARDLLSLTPLRSPWPYVGSPHSSLEDRPLTQALWLRSRRLRSLCLLGRYEEAAGCVPEDFPLLLAVYPEWLIERSNAPLVIELARWVGFLEGVATAQPDPPDWARRLLAMGQASFQLQLSSMEKVETLGHKLGAALAGIESRQRAASADTLDEQRVRAVIAEALAKQLRYRGDEGKRQLETRAAGHVGPRAWDRMDQHSRDAVMTAILLATHADRPTGMSVLALCTAFEGELRSAVARCERGLANDADHLGDLIALSSDYTDERLRAISTAAKRANVVRVRNHLAHHESVGDADLDSVYTELLGPEQEGQHGLIGRLVLVEP